MLRTSPALLILALPAAAGLALALPARAAQITEVADAVDEDDPFDAYLEVKFDVSRHSGTLTRENTQIPTGAVDPATVDVREMTFEHVKFRVRPRLEVGIYRDIAVFAEWPIVIWHQQTWRYADGTNDGNSTLARDQFDKDGSGTVDAGEQEVRAPTVDSWPQTRGSGNTLPQFDDVNNAYGFPGKPYNQWRFDHANNGQFIGYRQGFDNPNFGVRFDPLLGFLDNERDDTMPSVVLQADYTPPFFSPMDPTSEALEDPQSPGLVSDGAHRFHFSGAVSKRFLVLDPYFMLEYGFGLPAAGGSVEGFFPRQVGGFMMGTEIVPYEDKKLKQRFAIDVAAFATYHSEGRDYSEASDVIQEQTYTDQWVRTGLKGGIFFRAFEYFFFEVNGTIAQDSEHLLTIEDFGTDGGDTGEQVNLDNPSERNPFYNPTIDTVGRRLKVESEIYGAVMVHAGITF